MKILDCTLRDGGYYNNWDFDKDIVEKYLDAIAEAGINYVELGLRQFKSDKFLGAHAYTTKKYLERLKLPSGPIYGVMVDAKTILESDLSQKDAINSLFEDSNEEKIGLVRIAAHFKEIGVIEESINHLKDKGYIVGLNMMQASEQTDNVLEETVKLVSNFKSLDVLYFADSLGSMGEKDLIKIINIIKKYWKKPIGFHSHNNKDRALENTKISFNEGCEWLDATVTGMGRGAGNTQTEYIVLDNSFYKKPHKNKKLMELVSNDFLPMKNKFLWGSSMEYFIGAEKSIHPTYIQTICSDESISPSVRIQIIEDLASTENPNSFSKNILDEVKAKLNTTKKTVLGENCADILTDREVLIVAQTDSYKKYHDAALDYVETNKPFVLSINMPKDFSKIQFDAIAISHNEKLRYESEQYLKSKVGFIAPKKLFEDHSEMQNKIEFNYGINVQKDKFKANADHCIIPYRITFAYAVAFCIAANAKKIMLCGFEGNQEQLKKETEMNKILGLVKESSVNLTSLTPTIYPIDQESIFNI